MTERRILTKFVGFIDTYAEQHRLQWGAMDRFSSGEEFLGAFTAGKYDLHLP